jgi:hypothetical protein
MRLRRVEDTHSTSQPLAEADVVEYERLVREVTRQVRPHSVEFGHTVNMLHSQQSSQQLSGRGGAGNASVPVPIVVENPRPTAAVLVSVSVVTL